MNLRKKKELAAKTLYMGKTRIVFNTQRLEDIKEAITKQDIRDLVADGAIMIKDIKGTKKVVRRQIRRRAGSVRKKVNTRKEKYMALTRKLRAHIQEMRVKERISKENYLMLRKEIKAHIFKDKAHLIERIGGLKLK